MGGEFVLFQLIWVLFIFLFGTMVGSFLNVCIARLPLEKSIIWPGSRCGNCLQRIRGRDNVPVLGYIILGGKCRTCGARFSSRYMWIELLTGLAFAALFCAEMIARWLPNPYFSEQAWEMDRGVFPLKAWVFFFHHAVLMSFLIAAAVCDLDGRVIPLTITLPGTLIGLLSSALHPWPWPADPAAVGQIAQLPAWGALNQAPVDIVPGVYPWPVWGPPPGALPAGSWQLGLVTGLTGALVGTFLLRGVKFLAEKGLGKEALGLGDADLMMMAGAFLGWQPIVVAFFVGAIAALLLAVTVMIVRRSGESHIPFGPGLAIGIVVTWLAWPKIGPALQDYLFSEIVVLFLIGFMSVGMLGLTWLLRLLLPPIEEEPSGG